MSKPHSHQLVSEPAIDQRAVLEVIENPTAREILAGLGDTPQTAKELSQHTGVPLSSVYRVLNKLRHIHFVDDGIRLDERGQHVTEYRRTVDSITIRFSDNLQITTDSSKVTVR